ncbi:tetratricopeptide repeat protein [Ferrimonas senticii]|uniref:tetratricopeptide repeat protein n=1 Tax=Ferrimonas senticii TaxID=394566 RepID=UPI000403A2A8|nr:tetratricopeptide repeat protein [Ferrimonas senticii]
MKRLTVTLALLLGGCSSEPPAPAARATLAELRANRGGNVAATDLTDRQRQQRLAQIYAGLQQLEADPQIRRQVEYRLAQVRTDALEQSDADNDRLLTDPAALQALIGDYQDLLRRHPNHQDNQPIRYQLAKALDLQGDQQQSLLVMERLLNQNPHSPYAAELQFRRGEIYYNLQAYDRAIEAYQAALNAENNQQFALNSQYMIGWSQFKQNQLAKADISFLQVLEQVFATLAPEQLAKLDLSGLDRRAASIAADTQRVLSISLSQQQQAATLVELVNGNTPLPLLRHYQPLLFANLAQFLWDNQLQVAAEQSYLAYIELAPNNLWAARYSLRLMTWYQRQGKFDSMFTLQRQFLQRYGLASTFWHSADQDSQAELLPKLLEFADDHSRRLYAAAQAQTAQSATEQQAQQQAFAHAADALDDYLKLAQLAAPAQLPRPLAQDQYLYAEARFAAMQYRLALNAYQQLAYPPTATADLSLRLQAAYATTVTARAALASNLSPQQQAPLTAARNRNDLRFIKHYPDDPRAIQLATLGAQYAVDEGNDARLLMLHDLVLNHYQLLESFDDNRQHRLITPLPKLSDSAQQQVEAVSQLLANRRYQLQRYPQAEQDYQRALQLIDNNDAHRHPQASKASTERQQQVAQLRELLASTIYLQGQQLMAQDPNAATTQLLRLGQVVPESRYRANAEFDAADLLLEQQQWQAAIAVLTEVQQRFADNPLAAAVPAKLLMAYEGLELWPQAAAQLQLLAERDGDPELQRQALFSAAEYHQRAGDNEAARDAYRDYAHRYPQPFAIAQEARWQLREFYRQRDEGDKQRYWDQQTLQHHRRASSAEQQAARAISLASQAALALGQHQQQQFVAIRLSHPLKANLNRKQRALQATLNQYQQVLQLASADYVPQATYQIAELYRHLAQALMSSERPTELDELALEEYELLLEELAYPFEEKAIELHLGNSQRAWQDLYDRWIAQSFAQLAELNPALYHKPEVLADAVDAIH